jgi:hypothetical protein
VGKMVSEKESQRDLRFGDPLGTGFGRFVARVDVMFVQIAIELYMLCELHKEDEIF